MTRLTLSDIEYLYDKLEERITNKEVPKEVIPLFIKWMKKEDFGGDVTSFLVTLLGATEKERYELVTEYIERRLRGIMDSKREKGRETATLHHLPHKHRDP